MKPYLHPVPIACLLIAIVGAATSNVAMVILGVIGAVAGIGFISTRATQRIRAGDDAESLSGDGRMLLRPVKKLAEDIEGIIEANKDSVTLQVIGQETLAESRRLLSQVVRSLLIRDDLKKTLRGRYEADKEIGEIRMRLEFADEVQKVSLDSAMEARTLELRHYDEIEGHVKRIELNVTQAEAALAEMKARLAMSVSGDKAALDSGEELRETLGRLKGLSASYEEAEQILRES